MSDRARTFAQDVAAFILNEARRDYNRLGYFPVPPELLATLITARRDGTMTRQQGLDTYRWAAGRSASTQEVSRAE